MINFFAWCIFMIFPIQWVIENMKQLGILKKDTILKLVVVKTPQQMIVWMVINILEFWSCFHLFQLRQ